MKRLLPIAVSVMLVLAAAQPPQIAIDIGTMPGAPAPILDIQPNGTSMIDIATPNGAGLSHNDFLRYNVGPTQLIVANVTKAVLYQLGGVVYANPNLHGMLAGSAPSTGQHHFQPRETFA